MRIAITGGVNSGKSLLGAEIAELLGVPLQLTDTALGDARSHEAWHEVTLCVAGWMREPGPWVIAGVRVPYAILRLAADGAELPDRAIYLTGALSLETRRQGRLTAAIERVWAKVEEVTPLRPWFRGPYHPQLATEIMRWNRNGRPTEGTT